MNCLSKAYNNPSYSGLLATDPAAKEIRALLFTPEALHGMSLASRNCTPAILPLEEDLQQILNRRGAPADVEEKLKNMALNMVKFIMEANGWQHAGCTFLPHNPVFQSAAFFSCRMSKEELPE